MYQLQYCTRTQGDCTHPPDAVYGVRAACLRPRQCVLANPNSSRSFLRVPYNYDRSQRDSSLWLHNVYLSISDTYSSNAAAVVWYPVPNAVRLCVTSVTIQGYEGGIDVRNGGMYAAGATPKCHLRQSPEIVEILTCLHAAGLSVYANIYNAQHDQALMCEHYNCDCCRLRHLQVQQLWH
jgi:hypothetical protein